MILCYETTRLSSEGWIVVNTRRGRTCIGGLLRPDKRCILMLVICNLYGIGNMVIFIIMMICYHVSSLRGAPDPRLGLSSSEEGLEGSVPGSSGEDGSFRTFLTADEKSQEGMKKMYRVEENSLDGITTGV